MEMSNIQKAFKVFSQQEILEDISERLDKIEKDLAAAVEAWAKATPKKTVAKKKK